jgi:hypothetical protein
VIEYTEKLTPSIGLYVIAALCIPFFTLTFAPFSVVFGLVVGVIVFVGASVAMYLTAPRITVSADSFQAGKAKIDRAFIGAVSAFAGNSANAERGVNLDARAWTLFRGYVNPVVKVSLTDTNDPTPYWLVSTRNPQKLAQILRRSELPS